MNDQEKSVMLARAMEWTVTASLTNDRQYISPPNRPDSEDYITDLYDPANMALAWRVHLWAHYSAEVNHGYRYRNWCIRDTDTLFNENAQRLWLDKILELAIEAGLVEVKDD